MTTAIRKALVLGGGIGGLAAATALAQSGVRVDLAEIRPGFATGGVGLGQPANGLRALRAIGVLDECLKAGFQFDRLVFRDNAGQLISGHRFLMGAADGLPAMNALNVPPGQLAMTHTADSGSVPGTGSVKVRVPGLPSADEIVACVLGAGCPHPPGPAGSLVCRVQGAENDYLRRDPDPGWATSAASAAPALIVANFGWMLDGFENYTVVPVATPVALQLVGPRASPLYVAGILAATLAAWALGGLVWGVVADYISRRASLVTTYVLFLGVHTTALLMLIAGVNGFFSLGLMGWMGIYPTECYPTDIRATAITTIFNLTWFLVADMIMLSGYLIVAFGSVSTMAVALRSIYHRIALALVASPETKDQPLPG